ncbi:MAG TPA: hypothetical protein VGG84_07995 [Gemmatimonadaceae bacterium]
MALASLLLAGTSCREGFSGFGAGPRARANAVELFGALADRHAENTRNAKYEYARRQMNKGALSPSHVFDDTLVWTSASADKRTLEVFGSLVDGRYNMAARPNVPPPQRPADGRHVTTLTHLVDKEYRWDTSVDFAIGGVRPADVAAVINRLMASGEARTEAQLHADLAASAPRSAAALSTLFSLDTLRPTVLADGTTLVTLDATVHSDRLKRRLPALSDFVHKYVDPARFHFIIADRAGAPFVDLSQRDRAITIKLRTQHGHLVPLSGPPRPLPDSLVVLGEFNVKIKIFHVGFHDLLMEMVNSSRDREHDWTFAARREPQWDLPFIVGRLIRAPLRRPFAGEGSLFRIGIRAGEGSTPSVIARQTRLYVQESAILNFLNSLSSTAAEDFGGAVEREENVWLRELFIAVRDDAAAALE